MASSTCLTIYWTVAKAKPDRSGNASHSAAVKRGTLGMNFDEGSKDLLAQRCRALFVGQGFQEEFDRLTDIRKGLLYLYYLVFGTLSTPGTKCITHARPVRSRH